MVVPQPRHQQSRRGVQLLPVDAVRRRLLRAKPKVRACERGVAAAPEGPRGPGGRRGGGRARGRPLRVVQRLPVLLPHPPSEAHRRPRSPRGAPRARLRLRVLGRVDAVAVAGAVGSERRSRWQAVRAGPGEAARGGGGAGGVLRAVRARGGRGARAAAALRGGRAGARAARQAAGERAAAALRLGRRGGAPAGGRARGVRDARRRALPAAPGRAAAAPPARRRRQGRRRAARLHEDARVRRDVPPSRGLLKTLKLPSMRFSDGYSVQNQKYLRTTAAPLRETCLPRENEPWKWSLTFCLKGWLGNDVPVAPQDVF